MIAQKTDVELRDSVLQELAWDSRVDAGGIAVTVQSGVVSLRGTVSSYAEKVTAQEATHRVPGVLDVANDITVVIPDRHVRSDVEVAAAVRHALEWDAFVPHAAVRTTVADGWVTLEGAVEVWRQRQDAEIAVRRLTGVAGVINNVVVHPAKVDPRDLKRTIEEALERRADRAADHIHIDVRDDTVTLSGTVRSWAEKRAILGAVAHAPGVGSVNDRLIHYQ